MADYQEDKENDFNEKRCDGQKVASFFKKRRCDIFFLFTKVKSLNGRRIMRSPNMMAI